ncbi:MAG TPA: DUF4097 family beta strand repeat-containing protein [Humibacter sp.]|nr:DUF4097 family beta strand repeat-containing protein [Humibacter sp.]
MAQEKWLINPGESKTIDLEVVRKLKVALIAGQVDVIGHDEPGARVEVHSVSGKELKVSIEGDELEVDHPQLRWDNFIDVFRSWNGKARADVSILVPRDVALKLGVVSASALVSGLTTDAKLSAVSGDITVDGLVGDLELNSVGGDLSIRGHRGAISAHTVSGGVMATGRLHKFRVDSVSGNVFLDVDGIPDAINSSTVSGDLTIRLDETVAARYRMNTVSGTLHLDDAIIRGAMGKSFTHESGPLEGRWVEVSANSVSGNVSVVRRSSGSAAQADQESA